MTRAIRWAPSSRPRPQPSTPQLLETTCNVEAPEATSASTRSIGTPHRPKPPTASEAPSPMSATAAAALSTTLLRATARAKVRCRPQPATVVRPPRNPAIPDPGEHGGREPGGDGGGADPPARPTAALRSA